MAEAYIFVAPEVLATADIPTQSLAYDRIADAGINNATFRGIYFELDQPQDVVLGFQADLAAGAAEQEFRASNVKLISYGTPTGIGSRNQIVNRKSLNSKYFDLQGRRIVNRKSQKGLYIVDGKKIIVE